MGSEKLLKKMRTPLWGNWIGQGHSLVGWIGVYDKKYRKRCIEIGGKTGLYKGEMVSKRFNYLPEFIVIEVDNRMK